jgi:hypothetical protein
MKRLTKLCITRCAAEYSPPRSSDCSVVFFSKAWHTAAAPALPIPLSDEAEESEGMHEQTTQTRPLKKKHPEATAKQTKTKRCNPPSSKPEMSKKKNVHHTLRCCTLTVEVK